MFRTIVLIANVLAACCAAACALTHLMSLIAVDPRMSARIFAVLVLVVFPLGGFAFLVSFRVGRTYATWGNHILAFILQRAPKWLSRLAVGTLIYAIVHLVVLAATRTQGATLGTRVPLAASAFVAWFYLIFVAVFTVALRDPKILGAKIGRAEQASTARPNN